jgi:hypothetical protein
MVQNTNSDTVKNIIDVGRLQVSQNLIPSEFDNKLVFTAETNPKLMRETTVVRQSICSNSTSTTMYTTPTDRDFYLTSATISMIKDVTSTSTQSAINLTPFYENSVRSMLPIQGITLTPQSGQLTLSLPHPMKLARNTTIALVNGTNVGNIISGACITGFIVENTTN